MNSHFPQKVHGCLLSMFVKLKLSGATCVVPVVKWQMDFDESSVAFQDKNRETQKVTKLLTRIRTLCSRNIKR